MTSEIGRVSLKNDALVIAGLAFKWFDANGNEHTTPDAGDLLLSQTYKINPGDQGVPEGASFRAYVVVRGATPNQTGTDLFIYRKDDPFLAEYTLEGDIFGVNLSIPSIIVDDIRGGLWHTIRHASGTWEPFGNVKEQAGDRGSVSFIACAGVNGELHVCITSNGYPWHTIRHSDGIWEPFRNVNEQAGDRGPIGSIACASVNGELHVCAVNRDVGVWHTIRHADGTWEPFGDVIGQAGNRGQGYIVECAGVIDELHVSTVT